MSKAKVEVTGFNNRGTAEHPFGFIEFNDGMRIGYARGAQGANQDGLFHCKQPYLIEKQGLELRIAHVAAATKWVREHLAEGEPSEEQS